MAAATTQYYDRRMQTAQSVLAYMKPVADRCRVDTEEFAVNMPFIEDCLVGNMLVVIQ